MELLPNENPSPADAEALLAKEMNQLSVEERANVLNDIHGITDDVPTPDQDQPVVQRTANDIEAAATMMELENSFSTSASTTNKEQNMDLNSLLHEMQIEIDKFFYKPAYNQALLQDSEYVKDRDLWLHMLRVKLYVAKDAANLLIKFFEAKLELFGSSKLAKKITIDDIQDHSQDAKVLQSGCIQLLPNLSDRAGRAIMCYFPSLRPFSTPVESVLRVFWYATMSAYENEDIQRRGQVLLVFNNNNIEVSTSSSSSSADSIEQSSQQVAAEAQSQPPPAQPSATIDRPAIWGLGRLTTSLPMRLTALHYLYEHDIVKPIVALMQMAVGTYQRLRMRAHCGTIQDCLVVLRGFGIPMEILPITSNTNGNTGGVVTLKLHETFIEGRQQLERRTFEEGLLSVLLNETDTEGGGASVVTDDTDGTTTDIDDSDRGISSSSAQQQQSQQQQQETTNGDTPSASSQHPPANVPGRFDVLLGVRGKASLQHPGNSRYCHIVEMNWPSYEDAAKYQKLEIADRVIETVRSSGGRFLKLENTQWVEMDNDTILREKVAHAFRNIRRRKQQQQQKEMKKQQQQIAGV